MRQLWINGKRMDSIAILRREFTSATWDARRELCAQLTDQCLSGALGSWLERQPELDLLSEEAMDLTRLRDALSSARLPDPAMLSLLSGAPAACFETGGELPLQHDGKEKRQQLQKLPWWPQASSRLQTVSDWAYVALNREQLSQAMRKHRNAQSYSGEGINTIYLCNTGTEFWLDLREHNRNLRFVALGAPRVCMDPRHYLPHIDLGGQNLYFEGFDLVCPPSTQFSGLEGRSKEFHLIR